MMACSSSGLASFSAARAVIPGPRSPPVFRFGRFCRRRGSWLRGRRSSFRRYCRLPCRPITRIPLCHIKAQSAITASRHTSQCISLRLFIVFLHCVFYMTSSVVRWCLMLTGVPSIPCENLFNHGSSIRSRLLWRLPMLFGHPLSVANCPSSI
jgi:hypothetical protein